MKRIFYAVVFGLLMLTTLSFSTRNFFQVVVESDNSVLVKGFPIFVEDLCDSLKLFLDVHNDDIKSARESKQEIGNIDATNCTRGLVTIHSYRKVKYKTYIAVNNEIERAYNELRNECSYAKFGIYYKQLNNLQREVVNKVYPKVIIEADDYWGQTVVNEVE
jgi:hypothetical protein